MTTIMDVEPPLSLEDLPDELLHQIFEFLDRDKELKAFRSRSPPPSYSTLYRMSLVNHRLRRLSLPILFKNICFELQLDDAYVICDTELKREVQRLMKALKCNAHLTPLIRNLSIVYYNDIGKRPHPWDADDYSKDLETFLIVDFLSRCTNLEHLELPRHIVFGDIDNSQPIIEALNRHPSDKLRLKFQYMTDWSISGHVHPPSLQSMSLSRVVCCYWAGQFPDEMKTWLAQGLNIEQISRLECNAQPDDSWMDYTYPGLTSIKSWKGNHRSLQFIVEFLQRHPLLKRIELEPGHEHDNTPWGVAFAKRMHPYSCKIFHPDRFMAVVSKVANEWLYEKIVVTFQDDIPHGGVGIIETMIQKLGMTLSQSPYRVFIGIDFLSPVGEYMTSEDLIGILTRNLSHLGVVNLRLGKFLRDILTRECAQILEPGSATNEGPIAGFIPFCERLRSRGVLCGLL
ncbi:hypothetical protein K435DRAFT_969613 [Dendrothele bispora CBS 962.96]|uniref:F-box domain-containing protein n=1 Tax=Dendrothele bispora (strain CBS 962.96) TaxID=1314807 RepID=A0A4S8LHN1_DENBC|nr:hypothetical protein K435DRAFT_969613 [Dendrothele bispora CBS 962.96]